MFLKVDKSACSSLPDSATRRILQPSRAGIGSSDGRGNTLKDEEILEPPSTRRRNAAGWRNGSQERLRTLATFELLKPRRRAVGRPDFPAGLKSSVMPRIAGFDEQGRSTGRGTTGLPGEVFGLHPTPTEPAPARAPGDIATPPKQLARERRQASSSPLRRRPHAGESGVDRKVGPISVVAVWLPPDLSKESRGGAGVRTCSARRLGFPGVNHGRSAFERDRAPTHGESSPKWGRTMAMGFLSLQFGG